MTCKRILLCLTAALTIFMGGCSGASSVSEPPADATGDRLEVVTTLFPYYDFVRQIAGEYVDLTLVLPAGMDSHSFEPTPADIRTMEGADILIGNGGAMETWVTEVLEAIDTSGMTVAFMMDYVDTVEEEIVEGMEDPEEEHEHTLAPSDSGNEKEEQEDHFAGEDYVDHDGHEEEIEYDEHVWTSPVNAMAIVRVIRDILVARDPAHADKYDQNAKNYLVELQEIDAAFREVSDSRVRSLIVVGDKFPFRYFADEYRLDYRAAFSGCSTDTEPSAHTIAYLIDKVKEEDIPVIYYLELSTHRVAEIISEETGAEPLLLHSCHNVTRTELDRGVTYAELMRQNVENLRKGIAE